MIILFNNIIYNYPYVVAIILILVGIYILVMERNLIRKIVGLNIMQSGIILFYVIIGKIKDGVPPVYSPTKGMEVYSNPTPHVLMLTAIVVGIATSSLAYSFIYIIYKRYNSIDEYEIVKINRSEEK